MGEYFDWVNVDKKEYIDPCDFDCGNKFHETMHRDSAPLLAQHTLLSDRWTGDHILFLGDECIVPDNSCNYVYQLLTEQHKRIPEGYFTWEMIYVAYRNVSAFFKEAEKEVRQEIEYYLEGLRNGIKDFPNIYGVDINEPYKGFFVMSGKRKQYVLNETKRVCYTLQKTKILNPDNTTAVDLDPLPFLLGYGRSCNPGLWIGDEIGVSDEIPKGYTILQQIYMDT